MQKVTLYGDQESRTINVDPIKKGTPKVSPNTIQKLLDEFPRRWTNVDEIVIQLKLLYQIQTSHADILEAIDYCQVEKKGKGHQIEIRRQEDEASVQHRKAAFAASHKLIPLLVKDGIDKETFWEWVKHEYNVKNKSELDPHQWCTLSAEMNAALREEELRKYLVKRIKGE